MLLIKPLFKIFFIAIILIVSSSAFSKEKNTKFAHLESENFELFLKDIALLALKKGISQQTLDLVLPNIVFNQEVLRLDKKQPEFSLTFGKYLNSRLSQTRLDNAKKKYHQHYTALGRVQKKYGVPRQVIVAFWGLETNFGNNTGNFKLIDALATLAFDKRRRDFFISELLSALTLIDKKSIPIDTHSSWAGAMGYLQFMPSNVSAYSVDANKNGLDLWGDLPDVFASGANFLQKIGWHGGEKWGREVILPKDFDYYLAKLSNKKPLSYWQAQGVRTTKGKNLPKSTLLGSIILPAGYKGPAFLVYRNFHAILNWNRSIFYALSVGQLSNRILNDAPLHNPPIIEPYIDNKTIKFVQARLNSLGFSTGKADGIVGSKTRSALRGFQNLLGVPADGHINQPVIRLLQQDQ